MKRKTRFAARALSLGLAFGGVTLVAPVRVAFAQQADSVLAPMKAQQAQVESQLANAQSGGSFIDALGRIGSDTADAASIAYQAAKAQAISWYSGFMGWLRGLIGSPSTSPADKAKYQAELAAAQTRQNAIANSTGPSGSANTPDPTSPTTPTTTGGGSPTEGAGGFGNGGTTSPTIGTTGGGTTGSPVSTPNSTTPPDTTTGTTPGSTTAGTTPGSTTSTPSTPIPVINPSVTPLPPVTNTNIPYIPNSNFPQTSPYVPPFVPSNYPSNYPQTYNPTTGSPLGTGSPYGNGLGTNGLGTNGLGTPPPVTGANGLPLSNGAGTNGANGANGATDPNGLNAAGGGPNGSTGSTGAGSTTDPASSAVTPTGATPPYYPGGGGYPGGGYAGGGYPGGGGAPGSGVAGTPAGTPGGTPAGGTMGPPSGGLGGDDLARNPASLGGPMGGSGGLGGSTGPGAGGANKDASSDSATTGDEDGVRRRVTGLLVVQTKPRLPANIKTDPDKAQAFLRDCVKRVDTAVDQMIKNKELEELDEHTTRQAITGELDVWLIENPTWKTKKPRRFKIAFKDPAEYDQLRTKSGGTASIEGLMKKYALPDKALQGELYELGTAKVLAVAEGAPHTPSVSGDAKPATTARPASKPSATPAKAPASTTTTPGKAKKNTDDDDLMEGD